MSIFLPLMLNSDPYGEWRWTPILSYGYFHTKEEAQAWVEAQDTPTDWQWKEVQPYAEEIPYEAVTRASGEVVCEQCGKPYWKHSQPQKELVPTLVRVCDGRLLKR